MKIHHSPSHWVMIALVLAALLLTLSEAHGQSRSEVAERSVQLRKDVAPERDQSLAKEQRSTKKAVRGVKRSISRAKHGTSPVDAAK